MRLFATPMQFSSALGRDSFPGRAFDLFDIHASPQTVLPFTRRREPKRNATLCRRRTVDFAPVFSCLATPAQARHHGEFVFSSGTPSTRNHFPIADYDAGGALPEQTQWLDVEGPFSFRAKQLQVARLGRQRIRRVGRDAKRFPHADRDLIRRGNSSARQPGATTWAFLRQLRVILQRGVGALNCARSGTPGILPVLGGRDHPAWTETAR
ncbi:hypothetical protein ACFFYR_29975 [Paraburkholderia dipogonis]|uniref:hypothetical protein n=1 Tax=Paraburkholderia dipogonis TaxID=1211383 RepID=UPI0035E9CC6A